MIKSMTGFGRGHEILNGRDITVEIRSVNHRYFELNCKLPRGCAFAEERLKKLMQEKISRGKVEVFLLIYDVDAKSERVSVNKEVIRDYISAMRAVKDEFYLTDDLSLSCLLRIPDAFTVIKEETDEERLWQDLRTVAEEALDKFVSMRETEGEKLREDILSRLKDISVLVEDIEKRSPQITKVYRERLYEKMRDILQDKGLDENRILLEAALFSEKTAVDEETVRLKSHICQMTDMLGASEPVGRKLDFLVQEMNRETNTIGSKIQDTEVTRLVVNLKSEIEKIREQIQNIE